MKQHALSALIFALLACSDRDESRNAVAPVLKSNAGAKTASASDVAAAAVSPDLAGNIAMWDSSACGDDDYQNEQMQRHPGLMGRSAKSLLKAYGKPSAQERFKVGEPIGIFYGAYGKMPKDRQQKNMGDPVRVLTWTNNSCNFSIFFLETPAGSSAIHAFEWAVGSDF
jgi:hypothetical protein